jgi:hypothetical protein
MYGEEYLGENVVLDYDDDMSVTVDDLSTMDSEIIEERRILKAYKKADSGYYSFKVMKGEDQVKVEVYAILNNGKIRHAITGLTTPYSSRSRYADLFFSVVDSSCAAPRKDNENRRKLYYHNPEEYERHFHTTVSQDIKEKWAAKNRKMRRLLNH